FIPSFSALPRLGEDRSYGSYGSHRSPFLRSGGEGKVEKGSPAPRSTHMATDGFTTRPVYMGTHGVLAAGHYLAARAGQLMFDRGGNAIDAVVASGFALNLLKPHLNGLGGEVPLLVY